MSEDELANVWHYVREPENSEDTLRELVNSVDNVQGELKNFGNNVQLFEISAAEQSKQLLSEYTAVTELLDRVLVPGRDVVHL